MASETPLQTFYKGSHVLITGATGFFGKVLIEKLLRCCPHVSKLYLLIRCKRGKTPEERLGELFDDPVFQLLPNECPNFMEKIYMLPGDCALPELGLDPEHVKLIQEKVTIVFHGAATVRFEENLKIAYGVNVGGVKEIIQLSHQMKNLKAIVHISTAFSNINNAFIQEKFYEPPSCTSRLERIATALTAEEIEILTPHLLQTWPNTYTMTKAISEHLMKQEEGKLPICVVRPSIVTSTCKEPIPGWIDNIYGPTGFLAGAMLGVIRVVWLDAEITANIIPVDMAVNAILLAAREASLAHLSGDKEIKVYNYESGCDNPLILKEYIRLGSSVAIKMPSLKANWYWSFTAVKHYYPYWIISHVLQYLPAYIIDGLMVLIGRKAETVKIYDKVSYMLRAFSPFSIVNYKFDNNNVRELIKKTCAEDKKIFYIDTKDLDWEEYLTNYVAGTRRYILKEKVDTLPQALNRYRRLYWLHNATKFLIYYTIAYISYRSIGGSKALFDMFWKLLKVLKKTIITFRLFAKYAVTVANK